ncbi:response regulator, partial [Phocaeicola vulgatus]|nr:response regulator [Phocaeicola vulgatus]
TVIHQLNPETADSAVTASILKLYLNSQNHLWIATEKGIMVYNHQTHECIAAQPYTKEFKKITAICEDGDGTMWLGTEKGIHRASRKGKQIKFTGGYEKARNLTPGKVLALYLNNYNQLLISYTDKIIQIDGKEKTISSIMILQKDLPNGHISCMIDDKNGNTWLGSNAGFITLNNKNNASYTYALPESYYDVCRLNDGKLLWANSTGLLYFEPRTLKESSSNCQFHISDIDINYNKVEIGEKINGQVILDKPAYLIEHLSLDYNNNNLILYLSDLKYGTSPNTVKYRLLPTEEKWNTNYDDHIKLSNIPPGKYVLEIRSSYPLEENKQITRLSINVNRYWAATGWAIAAYILAIIIISLLTWMYFNRKLQKRQVYKAKEVKLKEKLEEETEIRKEEEKNHQLRDQIRYMLAQELRTPLSLITAPLKEMITNTAFPESFLQKAKMAYRNSISLQDICNQLLNIHQQESYSPKLNVAPYPASVIADTVVRASHELLNVSPINLHYDKDNKINTEIWIDRKKIIFILSNILSNAYRHISYSGSIHFTVNTSTINGKDFCLFTIEDDGKEMIEESSVIFLGSDNYNPPSNRLHPELGIEIMKTTILAHHGDIQITQEKNKGTRVVLYIPLGKQHLKNDENVCFIEPETIMEDSDKAMITAEDKRQQEIANSITAKPIDNPETKYKLLVVEDHADIRLYLRVLFSATYNIIMAENGEEGVRMARKEIPDLVITDVMMPVMNGFECCRILKEDLKTCHIPIILLTALTDDENIVKGIELGADDYILKPFNPEILRTKVKRLIKSRTELKRIYTKLLMPSITVNGSQEENTETIIIEDPFITQILNIVNENLQNPEFNVKKLAEMLNMSQPTLYRKVKQLTNFTIIELVRGVRLKRSAELLRSRKYNVQEVAEMVGYNDIPTFRKHFVDFYGTTPSTFNSKEDTEDKK